MRLQELGGIFLDIQIIGAPIITYSPFYGVPKP